MHTGQHYDDALSTVFFEQLGLARPERELGIGGGSNTSQLARMLSALEPLLAELTPDGGRSYTATPTRRSPGPSRRPREGSG